ncbi:MAG: gamma-glutamyltransferase family protein [Acidimicrobiia bacterium]
MPSTRPARRFPRTAVATPHYLASAAGAGVLARGGNAVDAAVAANITLAVVAPYTCGPGGDLFAIVHDGAPQGYLGSGRSAVGDSRDALIALEPDGSMPVLGARAVAVPGAVDGWFALLERWGTRSFGELAADAHRYATDGFEVPERTARDMFEGFVGIYGESSSWFGGYGSVRPGTRLHQPDLARTLELLATDGPDAYYRGAIAEAIADTVQAEGGRMTVDDLRNHRGEWTAPLSASFRDVTVYELPPPTQGVTALEALRIADRFPRRTDGPDRQHLLVEAVKQSLADRDEFVSDPGHMRTPAGALITDEWVASRRSRIDPTRALRPVVGRPQQGGTAYLCAADGDGLLVSLIQSNFLAFGSGVRVRGWGINLNNRASSFNLDPTSVNVFAPGKRPMHTLVPAFATRDGRPWLVFGTMGADAQTQVHVQLLTRLLDDRADVQEAIDAPRWRVEPGRWGVTVERRADGRVVDGLRTRGHEVTVSGSYDSGMGHAHAIEVVPAGYAAAGDPRADGAALGS